ncbi:hypothetical protein ACLB2K_047241 [Fragaria x ananassa]
MGTPYPNPISPAKTRIGWIGIGVMGAAMASRLISAGYSLTVYARTPSKAAPLQSQGARLADCPFQLAQLSDVVFTMVGHPSDVRSNYLSPNALLSGLNPDSVTVDIGIGIGHRTSASIPTPLRCPFLKFLILTNYKKLKIIEW